MIYKDLIIFHLDYCEIALGSNLIRFALGDKNKNRWKEFGSDKS